MYKGEVGRYRGFKIKQIKKNRKFLEIEVLIKKISKWGNKI